jgi:hypothetical protein
MRSLETPLLFLALLPQLAMLFRLISLLSLFSLAFALPQQLTLAPPMDSNAPGPFSLFSCPSFTVKCVLDKDWLHPVGNVSSILLLLMLLLLLYCTLPPAIRS